MGDTDDVIPRRLALRILAACLSSQARAVRSRTERRSDDRRGPDAAAGAAAKQARRDIQARDLAYQADVLSRWIGDPAWYQGPGLPAALVGHLAALAMGHAEAWPAIVRAAPQLAGSDRWDMHAVLDRLLSGRLDPD
jgi:hypothetical protein